MKDTLFFDVHSHIHGDEFERDRDEVLKRMEEARVATIAIGTDLDLSKRAVSLAERHPSVFASVGVHPRDNLNEVFDEESFVELAHHPKVVAIGECGLDYFRISETDELEKDRQRTLFKKHIELANHVNKPLMLHTRPKEGTTDAHKEMIGLLKEARNTYPTLRANVHFFTSTLEIAREYVALGCTLSFPGVITFKGELDEVLRNIPLVSILSETDAPYASPVPFRGKRNEPAQVVVTVDYIGKIRPEGEREVREVLYGNARRFFGL